MGIIGHGLNLDLDVVPTISRETKGKLSEMGEALMCDFPAGRELGKGFATLSSPIPPLALLTLSPAVTG